VEHSTTGLSSSSDRFEAFVLQHQDLVFGTAVRLLGDRSEAEDVAQVVFLKAFQRFAQIGASPTAGAWLRTVTRNACLNHLTRHRSRWLPFSQIRRTAGARDGRGATLDVVERTIDPADSPLAELERTETQARLEEALRRLPDHQRVPLVLFHFEQLSYQEIADTLGVALAKLKTDMHRGRLALRSALGKA
jgi:RNA polymerase sigma-70 factor (ECF subfamily)